MIGTVSAIPWYPYGNINIDLQNDMNISGVNYIFAQFINGTFTGDGSGLGVNTSFNQTLTDELYIAQSEESNLNVNSSNFWDSLDTVSDILGSLITNDRGWLNFTQISQNFFNKTETVSMIDGNISDVRNDIDGNFSELDDSKLDKKDQRYNNTELIEAVNTTENINGLGFNITTELDNIYIAQTEEGNLNVNHSTSTTFWASVSSFVSKWFYDDLNVLTLNETVLNNSIDDRGLTNNWASTFNNSYDVKVTDNESWNQVLASTLYISQSNEGNLNVNSSDFWDDLDTINSTQMEDNDGTLNIILSWFSSQFDTLFSAKDTDDLSEGSSNLYDNRSFNQTLTDSIYGDFSFTDFQSSFDLNFSAENIGDFFFSDFQSSFTANYSDIIVNTFNVTYNALIGSSFTSSQFQSAFDTNFSDETVGDFFFTDYQASFNSNFSAESIGDFSFSDFQASFSSNLSDETIVTSVAAGNGMDFSTITSTGSVIMGTPDSLTAGTSNAVTATSHTHAVSGFLESLHDDTTPQLGGYLDTDGENIGSTSDEIENIYVGSNVRIWFGDGQEGSIYFNGSNLVLEG